MVRATFILFFLLINTPLIGEDAYEKNCVSCHKKLPTSLQKMFMRYLSTYSGENNLKAGLKRYLKEPSRDTSVMQDMFLDRYGVKKPTKIDTVELDKAIDIYWEKYKVFGKLE
jgi:hypothetical protein